MPKYIRRRAFRPRRRGIPPVLLPLLVALGLTTGFFRLVSLELRPMIETVAVSQATNLISSLLSAAVDDCLSEEQMEYSDFVSIETDETGTVTSLTGRPAETSRFKRLVIQRLTEQLEGISPSELAIPVGNLTGSLLLSGLGPDIRVKIYTVGDVVAAYRNSFTAAGVNQTHHVVYLDITATVYLLIPGEIIPVTVTDSVCAAETVILGEVPDTYIHMEKGESANE